MKTKKTKWRRLQWYGDFWARRNGRTLYVIQSLDGGWHASVTNDPRKIYCLSRRHAKVVAEDMADRAYWELPGVVLYVPATT